ARQIELRQCHDDSPRRPAGARRTAKQFFERLLGMILNVFQRRLRGALCKRSVAHAVDDTRQGMVPPLLENEGVAILGNLVPRARGGAELQPAQFPRHFTSVTLVPRPAFDSTTMSSTSLRVPGSPIPSPPPVE